jgi:hypothetical protein
MHIQMDAVDEAERAGEKTAAPCYVTSDATIQAVGEILRDNGRGILLSRDELDGWLQSLTRYCQRGTDRPHWLEMHSARTLRVHRITRQRGPLSVRRACCSICGTIQPLVLARAIDEEARASGLLARLLLAAPPTRRKVWTEAQVAEELRERYTELLRDLLGLPMENPEKRLPYPVDLHPAAKQVWVRWYNEQAARQADSQAEQAAVFAKLEAYTARLALIHHVVSVAAAGLTPEVVFNSEGSFHLQPRDLIPISERSMLAAIELTEWFTNEALRLYDTLRETEAEREQHSLLEWIDGRGGQTTARELWRSLHSRYLSVEDAEATLAALVEAGYGKWTLRPPGPQGGRPTRTFTIFGDETSENCGDFEVSSPMHTERDPGEEG